MAIRLALGIVAFLIWACATPASSGAHDSLAPHGAPHHWLPNEAWSRRHWIPFDEADLRRALGLTGRDLEAYLYDDHRTLAALAAMRGIDHQQLAAALLARWPDDAAAADRYDHTIRILTQGHLAQHVLFHVFHLDFERQGGPAIFGMGPSRYKRLRKRGRTPLEIAGLAGVPAEQARAGMIALLQRLRDDGVAAGLALPTQADRMLRRQLARLPCWLESPLSPRDPGNPYGKGHLQHPHHHPGWPVTAAQRRASERRIDRVRRALPTSCWRPPPAWNWPAHGLTPP